jgi:predicted phage terminase large subunit-like protein
MSTRANDATARRIVMHQRLAENDLIGFILSSTDGGAGWDRLTLPMEYEKTTYKTTIGWEDPRKDEGELLWPERLPLSKVNKLKKDLGSFGYSAQYQQRPVSKEGGLIKKNWIKYYNVPFNSFTVRDFDVLVSSWDLSFSDQGDYTVGEVWGKKGPNKFLVDEVRGKWTFTEQLHQIEKLKEKWPTMRYILVENKANGAAVIDVLKKRLPGLLPIDPKTIGGGDKEVRLSACALEFEAGNVYIPSQNICVWTKDWTEELTTFPKGKFDDRCDSVSQALNWIAAKMSHNTVVAYDPSDEWTRQGYSPTQAKEKASQQKQLKDFTGGFIRNVNTVNTLRKVFD